MKNIVIYYVSIFLPLVLIGWLAIAELISYAVFTGLALFYLFFYRTYLDGSRLVAKGRIKKKDIWKMIIPGRRVRFFKDLYLKR